MNYFVICGHHKQFKSFVDELINIHGYKDCEFNINKNQLKIGDNYYSFINEPDNLLGHRNFQLLYYGTWDDHDRETLDEFHLLEQLANL